MKGQPVGLTDDSGHWVPDHDTDEYQAALTCISLRENGHSWREIERETTVSKDTARRISVPRERYQPSHQRGDTVLEAVR